VHRGGEGPVTPLAPDQPPPTPAGADPGLAIPDRVPDSATDLSAGPKAVNDQMAASEVTEDEFGRAKARIAQGRDELRASDYSATRPRSRWSSRLCATLPRWYAPRQC
jgi:hypothetical protein